MGNNFQLFTLIYYAMYPDRYILRHIFLKVNHKYTCLHTLEKCNTHSRSVGKKITNRLYFNLRWKHFTEIKYRNYTYLCQIIYFIMCIL